MSKIYGKNMIAIFILCILLFMGTGCWDWAELEEYALVTAIGIDYDKKEDMYEISVMVAVPSIMNQQDMQQSGQENGSIHVQGGTKLISSKGYSLFEAIRLLIPKTGRKFFFGNARLLVISEDTAKKGIGPVLDFFNRDHEPRNDMTIMVCEGKAKQVLAVKPFIESIPSEEIVSAENNVRAIYHIINTDLHSLVSTLYNPNIQAVTGLIRVQDNNAEVGGGAVFKGKQMVGKLSKQEAEGYNMVMGRAEGGIIVSDLGNNKVSFEMLSCSSKMSVEFEQGQPVMILKVETYANISELQKYIDLSYYKNWVMLEKEYQKAIENKIKKVIYKAQKQLKSDIFGFGDKIYHTDYNIWNDIKDNWDEVFKNMDVNIQVEGRLGQSGLTLSPLPD